MMNTQPEITPEPVPSDEDLRYAPPVADSPELIGDVHFEPTSNNLDIDAALAAVATLDDILAEEEAAEQARIAREEAEAQAQAERQARLKNPELFFPMPPLTTLQRGRLDSVIPALALIGVGAWLTVTITSGSPPAASLVLLVILGALSISMIVRWLTSSRWASGNLFFGLTSLFIGGAIFALLTGQGQWPVLILALGGAFILSGLLTQRRLIFPGLLVMVVGIIAYLVVSGVLPWQV